MRTDLSIKSQSRSDVVEHVNEANFLVALTLLINSFANNKNINWLIGSFSIKSIKVICEFCLVKAMSKNGAYITKNREAVFLIYEKNINKKMSLNIRLIKLWLNLVFNIIGIRIFKVLAFQKKMNRLRPNTPFLYCEMIAIVENENSLRNLLLAKQFIENMCIEKSLDLHMQTSTEKLQKVFTKRASFCQYAKVENSDYSLFLLKKTFLRKEAKQKQNKIEFLPESDFFKELNTRVASFFKANDLNKYANKIWFVKAFILILSYVGSYLLILSNTVFVMYAGYMLIGILSVLIGLNIGHDAAHGTISKKKWVNSCAILVFDLVGANSYLWKLRHIHGHHPFPNIVGKDMDIQQSKLVRIFPSAKVSYIHKFQHIYSPILFICIYTVNWMFLRDPSDFRRKEFGNKRIKEHKPIEKVKMIFFKMFYVSIMIIVPYYYFGLDVVSVFLGFLLLHLSSGVVISIALISAHVGDHHQFPEPNKKGQIMTSWSEHQINTTSDFCTDSFVFNQLFGGFNHHVIHHLFQRINHIHYPKLTELLVEVCDIYGMKYRNENDFKKVCLSHYKLLKREGLYALRKELNVDIG
jgi:linoleoyl-CoA desaturase